MTQKKVTATSSQQLYGLTRGTTSSIGFPYPYTEAVNDYLLRQNGDYILLQTGDKIILNG